MELYQLKTFLVIARTGNLTRAAAELHSSQPTASGQLKALEDELGVTLFLRTTRGMTLTEAGKQLLGKARDVTERATEFTALAASLAKNSPTCSRVGLNTTAMALRIADLAGILAITAPQLRLELHQAQSFAILEGIARGELDGGFFFGRCESSGLASFKLLDVELAVVGPDAWKNDLANAAWEILLEKPWVMPPDSCPFYDKTRQLLLPLGKWPNHPITADDETTLLDLVRAEAGIALLPTFMVENQRGVSVLRCTQTQLDLAFAWQTARGESPQVRPVREALERLWRDGTGPLPP